MEGPMKKTSTILEAAATIAAEFGGNIVGSPAAPTVTTGSNRCPLIRLQPAGAGAVKLRLEDVQERDFVSYVVRLEEVTEAFAKEVAFAVRTRNHVPSVLEPRHGLAWERYSPAAWAAREGDSNLVEGAGYHPTAP
jgi:hypothetical protein